jgi:hypothetical protein
LSAVLPIDLNQLCVLTCEHDVAEVGLEFLRLRFDPTVCRDLHSEYSSSHTAMNMMATPCMVRNTSNHICFKNQKTMVHNLGLFSSLWSSPGISKQRIVLWKCGEPQPSYYTHNI